MTPRAQRESQEIGSPVFLWGVIMRDNIEPWVIGSIQIKNFSKMIDAHILGIFFDNLQDMTDKVAMWMLTQDGLFRPTWRRKKYLPVRRVREGQSIAVARVRWVSTECAEVDFVVPGILADKQVRRSLRDFTIYLYAAIAFCGANGLTASHSPILLPDIPPLRRSDPFDVGCNVREIITAITLSTATSPTILELTFENVNVRFFPDLRPINRNEVVIRISNR